jgi:hypothetical protein
MLTICSSIEVFTLKLISLELMINKPLKSSCLWIDRKAVIGGWNKKLTAVDFWMKA